MKPTAKHYPRIITEPLKTVAISFQIRVPKSVREADIRKHIKACLRGDVVIPRHEVRLYKDRIEVFMP